MDRVPVLSGAIRNKRSLLFGNPFPFPVYDNPVAAAFRASGHPVDPQYSPALRGEAIKANNPIAALAHLEVVGFLFAQMTNPSHLVRHDLTVTR